MFRKRSFTILVWLSILLLVSCSSDNIIQTPTEKTSPSLPNPASVYCEDQGYQLDIRTAEDGSQLGYCVFADGTECEEWDYYRGECGPGSSIGNSSDLASISTQRPIEPADYEGWWMYAHPTYTFTIMLPEDWIVEEVTTSDQQMNGHLLNLHPKYDDKTINIRMSFRRVGDEALLWPTGMGQGELIQQGDLFVGGERVHRWLLVCPSGEVTAILYHPEEVGPNITLGDIEFGFIYNAMPSHCESGYSLDEKMLRVGEMIISSLALP